MVFPYGLRLRLERNAISRWLAKGITLGENVILVLGVPSLRWQLIPGSKRSIQGDVDAVVSGPIEGIKQLRLSDDMAVHLKRLGAFDLV